MGTSTKYRILAFDPGIANTGWSLLESTLGGGELTVLKMGELHPGPTADRAVYRDLVERFDKRVISLSLLREFITGLLNEYKPDFVCCEDIYISMAHPTAYGSLAMWICTAKMTVMDVAAKKLFAIPTKICKQSITGSGGSGKNPVFSSVLTHKDIHFVPSIDKRSMTEHQADSIAVAYAFHTKFRDYIEAYLTQVR